ncbi:MAG: heme lyase CcmF/NrfE family subunit [Gammaproteobacteria bacterium]
MIPELGQFALILALCIALVQGAVPLIGTWRGDRAWMGLARRAASGQFVFLLIAFGCLTYAFIANDFSVRYVAGHSNSALPLPYRISAVWGGHEGSLLLWVALLGAWTVAVSRFSRNLPLPMVARVLGVMGLVSVGFLSFLLFTSNPFERLLPAALDGRDLNPMLQDPGLIFHPPMLYMGYVGFSVAFAFAIAALLGGRLDAAWARWSRPWTTAAWIFLTLGIALGSAWAYYELGWGGWWFWDPVENASFMPWLVGTALMHSLAVTEKRGSFKNWTVLLAILAFSLSLLGTFLVRSGVLTSVHAFASDPRRGVYILAFLILVVGLSLLLYAWRAPRFGLGGSFGFVSRESLLLVNNVLLTVAAGAVLLGTLYPLILDALGLGKISVGPPYFEAVFVPLMAPLVFLIALGPWARWKQASLAELARRSWWVLLVSGAAGVLVPWAMGRWSALAGLGVLLAVWVFVAVVRDIVDRLRRPGARGRLAELPRAYLGMHLAHIGVAVFIIGVTLVKGYEVERDVRMVPGETVEVAGYRFRFESLAAVSGPNYEAVRARFYVSDRERSVGMLFPEKRMYTTQRMPMTEAGIERGVTRDLYVALSEQVERDAWLVRIHYKPFVNWIWGGCLLMALGGALAASDRRYRLAARRTAVEARSGTAGLVGEGA